jgi:hypothetical protein
MNENRRYKDLTKLWVELEWRRCAADETYFLETYVWIPSEEDVRGRVKFELFDYQHDLLSTFKENRFVVSLKARQLGYTTLAMAHSLWIAMFRPGATVLIVSRNQKSANKNLGQARLAYQFLPTWMKDRAPRVVSDSTDGMVFEFSDGMQSKMKSSPATEGVFAGETATLVVADEFALIEPASRQEDVLRTLLPTTDAGGSMIIISTSRGSYNRFAKTYRAAANGNSQFVSFFQPWTVSPFMQCSKLCGWCSGAKGERVGCGTKYDLKRREFSDQPWRFLAEYPADDAEAFRESGRPRFVGLPKEGDFEEFPYRGRMVWKDESTVEFQYDEGGPLRMATLEQDPQVAYFIGADPASGTGSDYSTAHVMSFNDDGRPVISAYYHANDIAPAEFAADLDKLGHFFAGRSWAALLAVEDAGGHGALPINELHKHLEYPNPYMHQTAGSKSKNRTRMFSFPMTQDRRKAVIDRLAKYLVPSGGELQIDGVYPILRQELGQFVAQETASGNIKYSADVGCHDDTVMSLAITLWLLVEEGGAGSPEPATMEDTGWTYTGELDLRPMREARERAIAAVEEQERIQWEAFGLNTSLFI